MANYEKPFKNPRQLPPESYARELTLQAFKELGYDDRPSIATLTEARKLGVFTCADALALGLEFMVQHTSRQAFSPQRGASAFLNATYNLCGAIVPTRRAQPDIWPQYYRDLRQATPTILLPAEVGELHFNNYTDLDPLHRQMNLGQILNPNFCEELASTARDRVYSRRLQDADQYHKLLGQVELTKAGVERFAEAIATPAVAEFDRMVGDAPA